MKSVYFVGLVGIGACIGQWVAVKRPDSSALHGQYGVLDVGRPDAGRSVARIWRHA